MAKFESKRPNITNQDAKNTKPTDFENKMHDATGLIITPANSLPEKLKLTQKHQQNLSGTT